MNKNNTNRKGMAPMNFYDDLVMQTQMNYSKYHPIYASGSTPYQLTDKNPLPISVG